MQTGARARVGARAAAHVRVYANCIFSSHQRRAGMRDAVLQHSHHRPQPCHMTHTGASLCASAWGGHLPAAATRAGCASGAGPPRVVAAATAAATPPYTPQLRVIKHLRVHDRCLPLHHNASQSTVQRTHAECTAGARRQGPPATPRAARARRDEDKSVPRGYTRMCTPVVNCCPVRPPNRRVSCAAHNRLLLP